MKNTFRIVSSNLENVTMLIGSISSEDDKEVAKVTVFYDNKRRSARVYTKHAGSDRNIVKKLNTISFDTLTDILYSELDTIMV